MWPGPIPTCLPSFILIYQPFGHSTPTSQTGQTDRQRSDSIGQSILQTVAQKDCQSRQIGKEDAIDGRKWRKLIKNIV